MQPGQKVYFLSDFHLGIPDHGSSLVREQRVVEFLRLAARDAAEIHIVGDIFDMWFEYRKVVPRGFVRLLGELARLTDSGLPVHIHIGNHDMWMFDYLPREIGVQLHPEPIVRTYNGRRFLIGHGDGLGPGDHGYKFIKKVFRNPVCQWLFARLHPNFGLSVADFWSGRSRVKSYENDRQWLGMDKEWLVQYGRERLQKEHFDMMVFGHRHLPIDIEVKPGSRYINLGDWISYFTYAVFDGQEARLMKRIGDGALEADQRITGGPAR